MVVMMFFLFLSGGGGGGSRDARGSLFLLRGREKMLGAGRGNSLPPGHFRGGAGRGGAFLKIFRARAPRGSHFPWARCRAGQGVHPCYPLLIHLNLHSYFYPSLWMVLDVTIDIGKVKSHGQLVPTLLTDRWVDRSALYKS